MNKRQAKKDRQKFVYGLADEWNLATMDEEELKAARKEFEDYCRKHRHYKHYRDREKIIKKPCMHHYPSSKAQREYLLHMLQMVNGYHTTPPKVSQIIEALKDRYGELTHEASTEKHLPETVDY